MKVGVLALQGAFREHREVLDALGVEAVEVRTPEQLGALDALILPGGESTTMSKLLDTSVAARAGRRPARRRPARPRHVRGHDPARARGGRRPRRPASRSAPSTSPCAATPTGASATRSRPHLDIDGLDRRPVPRRVHPRAAASRPRAPASRCSPGTTATRCWRGSDTCGSPASTRSCPATSGSTSCSCRTSLTDRARRRKSTS